MSDTTFKTQRVRELERLRTRERDLELEAVGIKARLEEVRGLIAIFDPVSRTRPALVQPDPEPDTAA